jgi:Protein of unknown function (DUF5661)
VSERRRTTSEEAKRVGEAIGVDWARFDLEQFRAGMDVEFEHGAHDPQTDVTHDDPLLTGKIALAHLKEFPDYYVRLERMEAEAERAAAARRDQEGADTAAAAQRAGEADPVTTDSMDSMDASDPPAWPRSRS